MIEGFFIAAYSAQVALLFGIFQRLGNMTARIEHLERIAERA
jgi:hypothetical protein